MIANVKNIFKQGLAKLQGDGVGAVLVRGASGAFVVKVLGAGLAFASQIALARMLGVENFGIYIYVISWMAILSMVGCMGFDASALRFVSSYVAHEEWGLLRGFFRRSRQLFLTASILVSALLAVVVLLLQSRLSDELVFTFLIACLLLPVLVSLQVYSAFLQGLKKIVPSQISLYVLRPLFLIIGVSCLFVMSGETINPHVAMFVNLLATASAVVVAYLYFKSNRPDKVHQVSDVYKTGDWTQVSTQLLLLSGFSILLGQTDVVMLGIINGTTDSGLYSAASKTSQLISFGFLAVAAIAAPMISQLHSQGKMNELQRMVKLAAMGIMLFSVPTSLFMFIFGEELLSWFGERFTASYHPMVILIVGQFLKSFAGVAGYLMTMTGHQKEAAYIFGIGTFLNIILNVVLIPLFGLSGAALATVITTVLCNGALIIYVYKKLNINSTVFAASAIK